MAKANRIHAVFLLFFFLILASRLAILWYSIGFGIDGEELARGVLPLHLERGLLMPVHKYQFDEYAGGSVVMGLLAYPFFRILGPSHFALKLSGLLFSLALFSVLFFLAKRFFGRTAAVFTGLVFLLAPTSYLHRSMMAFGNHVETATFCALGLLLFYSSRQELAADKPRPLVAFAFVFLFGLVSGFATYFEYEYLIFFVVILPFLLLAFHSWKMLLGGALSLGIGFRLGLIPWYIFHSDRSFFYNLFDFFRSGSEIEKVASHNDPGVFWQTITTHLPRWFQMQDLAWPGLQLRISGYVFDLILFMVFFGCWAYLAYRSRHAVADILRNLIPGRRAPINWSPEHLVVPVLLYVPVHMLFFALYPTPTTLALPPHKYLHAMYFAYFLLLAVALGDLWNNSRRIVAGVILALITFSVVLGNVFWFVDTDPGGGLRSPGYSHRYFGQELLHHYLFPLRLEEAYMPLADEQFGEQSEHFFAGLYTGIAYLGGADINGHLAVVKQGGSAASAYATGLGLSTQVAEKRMPSRLSNIESLVSADNRVWFKRGQDWIGEFVSEPPPP